MRFSLRVFGAALAFKAALLGVLMASNALLPAPFSFEGHKLNFHWPPGEESSPRTMLKTWDAQHYLYLAERGYRDAGESARFFPLWPWAISSLGWALGGLGAGLLLANLLSAWALAVMHEHVRGRWGGETADLSLALLLCYPGAFFLHLPYSESLFVALLMLWLAAPAGGRWGLAAAAALPLARPTGVLAAAAMRRRGELLAVAAGAAAYALFMTWAAGGPLAGLRGTGEARGAAGLANALAPWELAKAWLAPNGAFLLDRVFWTLALLLLPALRRLDRRAFWLALPMIAAPALGSRFDGMIRSLLGGFPVAWAAADAFRRRGLSPYAWALCGGMLALQVVLLLRHANNYRVG